MKLEIGIEIVLIAIIYLILQKNKMERNKLYQYKWKYQDEKEYIKKCRDYYALSVVFIIIFMYIAISKYELYNNYPNLTNNLISCALIYTGIFGMVTKMTWVMGNYPADSLVQYISNLAIMFLGFIMLFN